MKSPIFPRLTALRLKTGATWAQLAESLEVDRSMIFKVKAGNRQFGARALFRLAEAEERAGIISPESPAVAPADYPADVATALKRPLRLLHRVHRQQVRAAAAARARADQIAGWIRALEAELAGPDGVPSSTDDGDSPRPGSQVSSQQTSQKVEADVILPVIDLPPTGKLRG